jgi:hypothetical protein
MQRTAEEFVHRLPNGRWFVGDFVRTTSDGQDIYLVEPRPGLGGFDASVAEIAATSSPLRSYAHSRAPSEPPSG